MDGECFTKMWTAFALENLWYSLLQPLHSHEVTAVNPRILIFLFLLLAIMVLPAEAEKTALRSYWSAKHFVSRPIPEAWQAKAEQPTEQKLSEYMKFDLKSGFSVSKIVARYGTPTRYLAAKNPEKDRDNFLIYDLPSGHSVALYVHDPPDDRCGPLVIIDAEGNDLLLVK
jgi:hypothetical protein